MKPKFMMKQKLKNDALWCKIAKNLAKCFIYEARINLWCVFWTLVFFLAHHTSRHLHKPKSYRIMWCCCWPPSPLPRWSWPGHVRGSQCGPLPGCCSLLSLSHCVPTITTSALTRVARARPGMASSATSHIYNSLALPAWYENNLLLSNSNSTSTTKPRMLAHDKHTHAHLQLSTLYMSVTKE